MSDNSVKVVILGAGGLVGTRLAEKLCSLKSFAVSPTTRHPLKTISLFDVVPMAKLPAAIKADERVVEVVGDLCDKAVIEELVAPQEGETHVTVIHLAAVLSGYAEDNFDLGMKVNMYGTLGVLECMRDLGKKLGGPQKYVYTSTDYVTAFTPTNRDAPCNEESFRLSPVSYGCQKACMELMVCDYSRRRYIDGRVARLSAVIGRPGFSNSISYPYTGIFTQPLMGKDYGVPLPMDVPYPVSSLENNINSFLYVAGELDGSRMDTDDCCNRVIQFPATSVTLADIWAACKTAAEEEQVPLGRIHPIEASEGASTVKYINVCPKVDFSKARSLGLPVDVDVKGIIKDYISRYVKGPAGDSEQKDQGPAKKPRLESDTGKANA